MPFGFGNVGLKIVSKIYSGSSKESPTKTKGSTANANSLITGA
jgi:hypothetical protein